MGETTLIEWEGWPTSGRALGAQKSAAKKTGCSLEEWRLRRSNGERWCYRCRSWKPAHKFAADRTRSTGSASICKGCNSRRSTISRYGISEEEMIALEADGSCPICERSDQKMEVDHDHSTGQVREKLCSRCNNGLGFFCDDTNLMARAISYLEMHRGPRHQN